MRSILFVTFLFATLAFGSYTEAATLKSPPANNGLVSYWSFNEGTSTKVGDFSGNGNHGTTTNMAFPGTASSGWGSGRFGAGLNFDGTDDYVQLGTLPAFTNITVTAWIRRTGGFGTNDQERILMTDSLGTGFAFYIQNTDRLEIGQPGNNSAQATSGAITDTNWHHVAVSYNGSNASFYVDGISAGSPAYAVSFSSNTYRIASASYGGYLHGALDDIRVYSRALSALEISQLYRTGQTKLATSQAVVSNGLIGWWTFDGKDMTGGRVFDRGSLGKTGTVSGIASSTFYTLGKIGQAGNFDGVDDYVTLGTNTYVNADIASGTFATWFKLDSFPANNTTFSLFDIEGYLGGQIYGASGAAFIRTRIVTSSTGSTQLALNRWYHYAQTWDGTTAIGYLDGVADTSQSIGSPTPSSQTRISAIGATFTPNSFFAGSMDDVRLYNRALSADEVRLLAGSNTSKVAVATNNGLVGYWSFNEGTSTLAGDFSGNGNTGTLTNMDAATDWVVGKVGKALDFDGVNDKIVTLAASDSFNAGWHQGTVTEGTFSAWIRTANYAQNNLLPIISSSDGYSANRGISFEYDPRSGSSNRISWKISRGQTGSFRQHCYVTSALSNNEWTHFAVVVTAAGTTFYKNGVAMAAATCAPGAVSGTTTGNTTYPLSIGGNDEGGFLFSGVIDEVRMYNRALSETEVLKLYRSR